MTACGPYKVPPSAYMAAITRSLIARRWWLGLAPAALMAYGAAADWRWAVVALILIFIVYPMAMSFTILRYATLPQLAAHASATQAVIDGDIIKLYRHDGDDDSPATCIAEAGIVSATAANGMLRIKTGPCRQDLILIPAECVPAADFTAILSQFAPEESYDFSN
ncbi:MAG: hypothetical protein K2L77_04680 [Muribaculaceae bacterium]|nr:hypothetical protein [Muribaculaceae bacterium]